MVGFAVCWVDDRQRFVAAIAGDVVSHVVCASCEITIDRGCRDTYIVVYCCVLFSVNDLLPNTMHSFGRHERIECDFC